jgi:hypothetical protein
MIHTEIGQRISPEVYNNYGDIKAIASHFRADYKQWYYAHTLFAHHAAKRLDSAALWS